MSQFAFTRRAAALSLALGLLAAAPAQLRAETEELIATEAEATLTQQIALAPSLDRDDTLLPEGKQETIAAVSVPEIAPQVAKRVLPEYPEFARRSRLQGMVFARVLIDENGKVAQVARIEGNSMFREIVEIAARQWEFTPAMQGREAVRTWATIPFSFEL